MWPKNDTVKNDTAGKKIDYKTEGLAFLKLKQAGEKITQIKFCERRSRELGKTLSLAYFKKVLRSLKYRGKSPLKVKNNKGSKNSNKKAAREPLSFEESDHASSYDWSTLKKDFIRGEHKNLSALARAYGINPGNYKFRKETRGWLKERLAISTETNKKTIEKLTKDQAAYNARKIYSEALVIQWRLFDILKEVTETKHNWEKIATPAASREVANFVIDMQKAFERILPNIQGLEKMTDMQAIFDGLNDGTMDIEQAAIGFVKLGVQMPEPLKMMLQKHQPEEAMPDDGDEISEEQILARREKMLQEIETERISFVTERKRDVAMIKKELAHVDSFDTDKK